MVTQVQLGNFFSVNGRSVLGGVGGSGLDTQTLIESLVEAKAAQTVPLQDKIELNGERTLALGNLRTMLGTFQDAANFLRNPPGVGNEATNIFKARTGDVTSDVATPGSTYLTVTAEPGATVQSYTINSITSLAKARQQTTGAFAIASVDTAVVSAAPAAGEFGAGTVAINGQNLTLADGDTLQTVANKFNAIKSSTGISATILQVTTGQFKIVFSATETGTEADFDLTGALTATGGQTVTADPDGVLTNITFNNTQAVSNAVFSINGNAITRQTNSVDDVIADLTFNLHQPTAGAILTVDIEPDVELVKSGIINFANAYNQIKQFAAEQMQLGANGLPTETAVLANSSVLRSAMNEVNNQLAFVVQGITAGDPSRLVDIGITFEDLPAALDGEGNTTPLVRNIMTIDEGLLTSAIQSNFEGVRRLFEFDAVFSDAKLQVFSRTNALDVTDFTLDIDPSILKFDAIYDPGTGPVTVAMTAEAIVGSGWLLTGPDGTPFEGLKLIYAEETDAAIATVSLTQGIADRVYNAVEAFMTDDTGIIEVELQSLADSDTRLQTNIDKINDSVAAFREELLRKFGLLEAAIARVNNLLQALDQQDAARNANA